MKFQCYEEKQSLGRLMPTPLGRTNGIKKDEKCPTNAWGGALPELSFSLWYKLNNDWLRLRH